MPGIGPAGGSRWSSAAGDWPSGVGLRIAAYFFTPAPPARRDTTDIDHRVKRRKRTTFVK
ncbi:hypothetical protein Afe04nite_28790 [Asanoa ferruginea]|nr:hypothetical protein Afe04nite_28790 [Asanoa ferruginea]